MRSRYHEAFASALGFVLRPVPGLFALAAVAGLLALPAGPSAGSGAGTSGRARGVDRDEDGTVYVNAGAPGNLAPQRFVVEDANGRELLTLTTSGLNFIELTAVRHAGNVVRLGYEPDSTFFCQVLNGLTRTDVESSHEGSTFVTVHKAGYKGPLLRRIDVPAGE